MPNEESPEIFVIPAAVNVRIEKVYGEKAMYI